MGGGLSHEEIDRRHDPPTFSFRVRNDSNKPAIDTAGRLQLEDPYSKEIFVATYSCPSCGMAVNASCAKCNVPLVNGILTKDDGSEVQVSWCPSDDSCGKIKSPMCCGADMACSVT